MIAEDARSPSRSLGLPGTQPSPLSFDKTNRAADSHLEDGPKWQTSEPSTTKMTSLLREQQHKTKTAQQPATVPSPEPTTMTISNTGRVWFRLYRCLWKGKLQPPKANRHGSLDYQRPNLIRGCAARKVPDNFDRTNFSNTTSHPYTPRPEQPQQCLQLYPEFTCKLRPSQI